MKKIWIALLLTLVLLLGAVPAYGALGTSPLPGGGFPDIADPVIARSAELLRLMGVLQGDEQGLFRPAEGLTRAQFCKMCVVLLGRREEAARYAGRTIFPDLRGEHWAAGYVNFAAASDVKFVHGRPDGSFGPDEPIRYGEAVTILMRLLGYTDGDAGPIWPEGYLVLARAAGVSEGLALGGDDAIRRSQAATLFRNCLFAAKKEGGSFLETLGTTGEETVLLRVNRREGMVTEAQPQGVPMAWPVEDSLFAGLPGRVVTDAAGRALTFLPAERNGTGGQPDAAVILSADGSDLGLDILTGGAIGWKVYRNGVPSALSELRRYDVVQYRPADNTLQASDTRVAVVYEDCAPSPAAPTEIEVLGGTRLTVLPTAQESLRRFRPGDAMVLLLAADGRVAGAMPADGEAPENALALVDLDGGVNLLCGGGLLPLELAGADTLALRGDLVRLRQRAPGARPEKQFRLERQSGGVVAAWDTVAMTMGKFPVSPYVQVFDHGTKIDKKQLTGTVPASQLSYARLNGEGVVDLIVLNTASHDGVYYGLASLSVEMSDDPWLGEMHYLTVDCGNGRQVKLQYMGTAPDGVFVRAEVRRERYSALEELTAHVGVPASAWLGDGAVMLEGLTWPVPADLPCYNRDTGRWLSGVKAAKAYSDAVDLYTADGALRILAVGGR